METVLELEEKRANAIIDALEGGSNYWYWLTEAAVKIIKSSSPNLKGEPLAIRMWEALKNDAVIPIHDLEDHRKRLGFITMGSIFKGEEIMMSKHPEHWADFITDKGDAITADVWFQLAVMADIVYG